MKSRHLFRVLLAMAVLALAGCGRQSPLSPTQSGGAAAKASLHRAAALTGTPIHLQGEIGPGALYSIDVPAEWNGDLVLYAHGYEYPQNPVALPGGQFPGVSDQLLSRGFAVAATSFSEAGYAEAEGARQVHQLRGLFVSRVGPPGRTFLVGLSLGGLISTDLLQSFPGQYAGALSVSGPLGGSKAEFDYVGDVRLLWDLLMPYDLPGTFTSAPATPLPQSSIVACIMANQPTFFGALAPTRREGGLPIAGNNPTEQITSVVSTLGFHWYGIGDALDRTHEHMVYDNHDAVYVNNLVPAAAAGINAGIARYTATSDALEFLRHHYQPDGVLKTPLLTIHAKRDPLVPSGHEQILHDRVAAAGYLGNLSQSIYDEPNRFGHTEAFTATQIAKAFDALLAWVNTGVKPAEPVSLGP